MNMCVLILAGFQRSDTSPSPGTVRQTSLLAAQHRLNHDSLVSHDYLDRFNHGHPLIPKIMVQTLLRSASFLPRSCRPEESFAFAQDRCRDDAWVGVLHSRACWSPFDGARWLSAKNTVAVRTPMDKSRVCGPMIHFIFLLVLYADGESWYCCFG
jgi:hypothetical protein